MTHIIPVLGDHLGCKTSPSEISLQVSIYISGSKLRFQSLYNTNWDFQNRLVCLKGCLVIQWLNLRETFTTAV